MSEAVEAVAGGASGDSSSDGVRPVLHAEQGQHHGGLTKLAIGAIGVVFGDIGTSPLYAMQAIMSGTHPLTVDLIDIYGVIGLIFWSMMLIVTAPAVLTPPVRSNA